MYISEDIKYIGVNDREIDLFEGQYVVPNGMAYNSYVIMDEKIAVMDTVDKNFGDEWLGNLEKALDGRTPDYIVIQHMEPDHSANIMRFAERYADAVLVASAKAFTMMKNFFGTDFQDRRIVVAEGDKLSLGAHELTFITAPMVHWPEVIVTYDSKDKVFELAEKFEARAKDKAVEKGSVRKELSDKKKETAEKPKEKQPKAPKKEETSL